jgi:hypothetical protein
VRKKTRLLLEVTQSMNEIQAGIRMARSDEDRTRLIKKLQVLERQLMKFEEEI